MQGIMDFTFAVVLIFHLLTACQATKRCDSIGIDVTIAPASQIVQLNGNATISCNGPANAVYQWFRIPTNTEVPLVIFFNDHYLSQNNGLLISNVTAEDAGKYFCEKVNPPDCSSDFSTLTIFEKASITITPKLYRKHTGGTLNLSVAVTGNPLPTTITLQKKNAGGFVDYPTIRYSVTDLRIISIPSLLLNDSGQYRACVENSHANIGCDDFEIQITGPPVINPINPIRVKDGGNFSVVCSVTHSFSTNYEITWQTANGTELSTNHHPLGRVTQMSTTKLKLHVETVTKAIDYLCVVKNDSRVLAIEYVSVHLYDVPSPPRDLKIQITDTSGLTLITWTAPETDNGKRLTAYYVNITHEGDDSMVVKIIPDVTSFPYFAGCSVVNVTVTSENDCGNSSAISASINTNNLCVSGTVAALTEAPESDDNMFPTIGAGIAVVLLFAGLTLFAIIVFVIWWNKQKKEIKQVPSAFNIEALQANSNTKVNSLKMVVATTPPPLIKRTTSIRRYRGMLEVPSDNIMLRDVLYENVYYELRKGLMTVLENENRTHEVMVKKAKDSAPLEEEHNIQEEIKMMCSVGNHENVVGLLRACTAEAPAYLITEYFAHGDLLGFLRASRGHYGMYTISPGTGCKTHMCAVQGQDLLKMATQVAAGMSYLAEKKITHRSLCARNVLVGTGLQVKVYNYGPKTDSEAISHNYVKWMAPETLFDGTANTMSDVWSFAVTLWEIITIGGVPYSTTHPKQMRELLHTGHRLPKPDHCADPLYVIMEQSWVMDPGRRPTFSELHKQLDDICKSKLSYLNTSLYNDAEYSNFEETHQLMTAL